MFERLLRGRLLLGLLMMSSVAAVHAAKPTPPKSLCVNDTCSSTPTGTAGPIKWNPGHYMASGAVLYAGSTLSTVQAEMDDLNGWDKILGYRVFITWGALETAKGQYDFSLLDAILNRLKTHYDKPKRLVIALLPGRWGGTMGDNDKRALPLYLQQSSEYGPSPVSGRYGWWGPNSGGKSTGAYSAALYRPAVMDRFIALVRALGAHYDNDPYFEAIMIQENSWIVGMWPGAPDYSATSTAPLTQFKRLLTASTDAFPHTNVVMENTWLATVTPTIQLTQWMIANRIQPGTADVLGQSAFDNHNYSSALCWGLQAYLGIANGGIPALDLRPQARAMVDVESAELSGNYFAKYGGPFTPLDIVNALNKTYKASHAFWAHFFGNETSYGTIPAAAKWKNLAATVSANPLTNTSYPPNYK